MNTAAPVSVATSLVPGRDAAIQSAAVASWRQLGWSVVSLNADMEAAAVAREFPGVRVVTPARNAQKAAGKPLPLICDLLAAARDNQPAAQVIGVINADIVMRDIPNLTPTLQSGVAGGLVMLPRVDVPDLAALSSFTPDGHQRYSIGYDGAFMSPALLQAVPDSLFCIGMPFWDYWLPLMALVGGHSIRHLAAPVALHVTHPTRWERSVYLFFHAMVGDLIAACAPLKRDNAPFEIVLDLLHHTYGDIFKRATDAKASAAASETLAAFYDRIQEVVVHHIKAKSRALAVPGAPSTS